MDTKARQTFQHLHLVTRSDGGMEDDFDVKTNVTYL